MSIEFKQIDRTNYQDCIELRVNDAQSDYVAPNIFSLVQATYEPNLYPLGVYYNGKMLVLFYMIMTIALTVGQ